MVQRIFPKDRESPWIWISDVADTDRELSEIEAKSDIAIRGLLRTAREEIGYLGHLKARKFRPGWEDLRSITNAVTFIRQAAVTHNAKMTDEARNLMLTHASRLGRYIGLTIKGETQ